MRKKRVRRKRLGAIIHYLGVVCEYLLVIFLAVWLNIVLKFSSLFSFPFKAFGFASAALGLSLIIWSCGRAGFSLG